MDCMALYKWIRWLYFHGLGGSATMEYSVVRGIVQILGFNVVSALISGIAGIGHIVLGVSLILILLDIKKGCIKGGL